MEGVCDADVDKRREGITLTYGGFDRKLGRRSEESLKTTCGILQVAENIRNKVLGKIKTFERSPDSVRLNTIIRLHLIICEKEESGKRLLALSLEVLQYV